MADINLVSIVESIAARDMTGINNRGLDAIPENAKTIAPVFYPLPNGFVTNMSFERVTAGADNVAAMNLSYTLNYRYLHTPIGSAGGLLQTYENLINNLVIILLAILADSNPTGAVDMQLQSISNIGALSDPAGEMMFHGVDIALRVEEFVQ